MREMFTENLSLKLFSLVLGLVIFFAVRTEQEVTTTVAMRLVLREPAGLINTSDMPPEVTVRLSGSPGRIRALAPNELGPVTLDLSSFGKGTSTLRIREDQLAMPPDLDVVSISPSTINVRLESRERRRLPVRAALQGTVADGYVIEGITVAPVEVDVEGPKRELRDAKFIRTAPVDVNGATGEVTASVVFELLGPHTRVDGVSRADVKVAVGQERSERLVTVALDGVPWLRSPSSVRAKLRGPRRVIEALDEHALGARAVVVPNARPGTSVPVRIDGLPEGVEVIEPLPTVPRPAPMPMRRR